MNIHLIPVSLLREGDVVYGYGHGSVDRVAASYYPFGDGPVVVRSVRKDADGFTRVTLGPADSGSITHGLDDEDMAGDLAAVGQATLSAIERRGPCRFCGRSDK